MKLQNSNMEFKKFVYIDSSQEEVDQEEQQQRYYNNTFGNRMKKQINKQSNANGYKKEIKQIIQNEVNKIEAGRILMVGADDKIVEENMKMRKQKYQYFAQIMQIDERYNKIQAEKVNRLKEQNKRKQEILEKKRKETQLKEEEALLRKYIIQKKNKQEQVINGVKKTTHKLTVERKVHTVQHIKTQIHNQRELTEQQLQNLKKKQKNQLDELRQKYEQLKVQKRVNKLDQEKVLREQQKQNQRQKKQLQEQLTIKDTFKL